MPGNLHSIGMGLTSGLRQAVANHTVKIRGNGITTDELPASSPPIGQELINELGLDLSNQNRIFYIDIQYFAELGKPQQGWHIIDMSDGSEWRILPQQNDYGWQWHGQDRSSVRLLTKQDI